MLPAEHLKSKLDKKNIGGFITELSNVEYGELSEDVLFETNLRHVSGQYSLEPVVLGVYLGSNKPTLNRLEIKYTPLVIFEGTAIEKQRISIAGTEYEIALFNLIFDVLQPGGTVLVEYNLKKQFLSPKATHRDARNILTELLSNVGFASIRKLERTDGWSDEKATLEAKRLL
jgi:hypothetical protein